MICCLWTTAISALDFNLAPALSCGPFARKFQSNFRLWENRNQFLRSWCHSCLSAFVLGRTPIRLLMHNLDFVVNWFQILCHQNSPEWCTEWWSCFKSGDMTKRCSVTIPAITVNGFIYWMPMQHCNMNVGLCLAKIQGLDLILMLTCIIFWIIVHTTDMIERKVFNQDLHLLVLPLCMSLMGREFWEKRLKVVEHFPRGSWFHNELQFSCLP